MHECYFCGTPLEWFSRSTSFIDARCLRCGDYRMSVIADAFVEPQLFNEEQVANISGYIRENQGLEILEKDINSLKLLRTPTVGEKAIRGLIALARLRPVPGQVFSYAFSLTEQRLLLLRAAAIDGKEISQTVDDEVRELLGLQASSWVRSFQELRYIIEDYFRHEGLVHYDSSAHFESHQRVGR